MMLATRSPVVFRHLLLLLVFASLLGGLLPVPFAAAQDAGEPTPEDQRAGRPLEPTGGVWFAEVVTDPQSDHDASGSTTSSDESFVLFNAGTATVTLDGWLVHMNDGTNSTEALDGTLAPAERRVWLNPSGQMNNDVTLLLVDAGGTTVDQVTLGADGVVDGNADGPLDEAVALVGPWAALHTPAAGPIALGAVWVESLARTGTAAAEPFAPAWLTAGNTSLDLRVHVAPNHTVLPDAVVVGTMEVGLDATNTSGLWRTEPFGAPSSDRSVQMRAVVDGTSRTTEHYPDASPLKVRVDATAPVWQPGVPVVNATAHVRWLAALTDDESGIDTFAIDQQVNGSYVALEGCTPFDAPAEICRLVDPSNTTRPANATSAANVTLRVTVTNGAGVTVEEQRQVDVDVDPPAAPGELLFDQAVPPVFDWPQPTETLKRIVVEVAEDVTGVYLVDEQSLAASATDFTDLSYTAGDPRAYRLRFLDRADHETVGDWTELPPSAVPVAVTWPDVTLRTRQLATDAQVDLTLTFDRTMVQAPVLQFRGNDSTPFLVEADGVLAPDARSAVYHVEVPGGFPWSGRGIWSTAGGAAEDDAVVAEQSKDVVWDLEAPHVTIKDAPGHWVQSKRHVVTIEAWDAVDDDPRVVVTEVAKDHGVWGRRAARKVTLRGEGLHQVAGHAEDAEDNRRTFELTVGLDATPPELREVERPGAWWNSTAPIRIEVQDATSGVVRDAVRLWVRNATQTVQVAPAAWDKDVARFDAPTAIGAPFELHVAAADAAGNAAEGLLGAPLGSISTRGTAQADEVRVAGPNGTTTVGFDGPDWGKDVPLSEAGGDTSGAGGDTASGAFFDAESWRGAGTRSVQGQEKEDADGVWYVIGGIGSIGLATVGQRAWQRKQDAKKKGREGPGGC